MDSETLGTLTAISIVAVSSPLLADALRRFRIAGVVIEILAGVVIGPQLLGLAEPNTTIDFFSSLGLAFLMFLAGYETDFARIRGKPIQLAVTGWGMSLVAGLAIGLVLELEGRAVSGLIIGLVLTTTALSTLLPMWRDSGVLRTRFGSHALAIGSLGEFGPIVVIALLLGGHRPGRESILLVVFVAIAIGMAALALRPRAPRVVRLLREHLHTSAQLPVRVAMLLIIALLWIADSFGFDVLLGAFTAGIVVRLGNTGETEPVVRTKLEAIGFGFLVPIFFVVSGMQFDLDAITDDLGSLLRIPLFLVLFLVVRGIPMVLYRDELAPGARWPMALFSATALPLVVVITEIGTQTGRLGSESAAALVGAAMLSVLVYPSLAFALLRRSGQPTPEPTLTEPEPTLTEPEPDD